jgi:hypothetical protein
MLFLFHFDLPRLLVYLEHIDRTYSSTKAKEIHVWNELSCLSSYLSLPPIEEKLVQPQARGLFGK